MKLTSCLLLALAAVSAGTAPLVLSPPAVAQTAAPALSSNADELADALLTRIGVGNMLGQLIGASRPMIIVMLKNSGPTEEQAGQIWDQYLQPGLQQRSPALVQRFRAILVEDFTVPELQAIVGNQQNAARQSAAAKVPHMQEQFRTAGEEWGRDAANQVLASNIDALRKLGVTDTVKP